jgi:ubiquinol-cytochrome c reductase cytochrome c1 subunit
MRIERVLVAAAFWAAAAVPAIAAEGVVLDRIRPDVTNAASLQRGARTFVNYCLNCHGAALVRYNQLVAIGLTETQIRDNLMFTAEKIGEPMQVAMTRTNGKAWFGVPPPDLSVTARSRGADWIYTYLRGYYRDPTTITGWNNTAYPNTAMPHVLWTLQGDRVMLEEPLMRDGKPVMEHGKPVMERRFETVRAGAQTGPQFDQTVYDLVNFLVYIGEPQQVKRQQLGIIVLFGLGVLIFVTWLLYKEFWKDVR